MDSLLPDLQNPRRFVASIKALAHWSTRSRSLPTGKLLPLGIESRKGHHHRVPARPIQPAMAESPPSKVPCAATCWWLLWHSFSQQQASMCQRMLGTRRPAPHHVSRSGPDPTRAELEPDPNQTRTKPEPPAKKKRGKNSKKMQNFQHSSEDPRSLFSL